MTDSISLDGVTMAVSMTADTGVVGAGTRIRRSAFHAGHSRCEVCRSDRGAIRVIEHFRWTTRDGIGTNVFDEVLAP